MLSFEDEGKMNPIPGLTIQPVRGFVPSSAATAEPAVAPSHRRVSVDDKRTIAREVHRGVCESLDAAGNQHEP